MINGHDLKRYGCGSNLMGTGTGDIADTARDSLMGSSTKLVVSNFSADPGSAVKLPKLD